MFKAEGVWVGVEVKSRVSDGSPDDYERGLYQVVKYKEVLEAQAQLITPTIRRKFMSSLLWKMSCRLAVVSWPQP